MGLLRDPELHWWSDKDRLSAAVLNHDFAALHMLAEAAADLAVTPDPDGVEALERVARAEARIAALERINTTTERQRGAAEYTPLASFGALLMQVNALRDPMQQATEAFAAAGAAQRDAENALSRRVGMLERKPEPAAAPGVAAFEALTAEVGAMRETLTKALDAATQAAATQAEQHEREVATLRAALETATARANKRFMPASALANILSRLNGLQRVLVAFENRVAQLEHR